MVELADAVRNRLREIEKKEVEDLWTEIYNSYEDGGPNAVKEVILKQLTLLKKGASREIRDIKGIIPKKEKRRR
jgi:uncharacterized protein (UPF0297 family)